MSSMTHITVFCSSFEDDALPKLQAWFQHEDEERERYEPLSVIPKEQWAGNKVACRSVLIGCYNYFSTDAFLKHVATLPWQYPGELVVIVEDEHIEHAQVFVPTVTAGEHHVRPLYDCDVKGREVTMMELVGAAPRTVRW